MEKHNQQYPPAQIEHSDTQPSCGVEARFAETTQRTAHAHRNHSEIPGLSEPGLLLHTGGEQSGGLCPPQGIRGPIPDEAAYQSQVQAEDGQEWTTAGSGGSAGRLAFVVIGPSIAYVPLTKGQFALIDAEDVPLVAQHKWSASWNSSIQGFYAVRKIRRADGRTTSLGLHVQVLRPALGFVADHISGATLDNRKANLRQATRAENARNRRAARRNTSGFKGVTWRARRSKWEAAITLDGKNKYLGSFATPESAHFAYRQASAVLHGEFGRTA